jgi:hypothetical protein
LKKDLTDYGMQISEPICQHQVKIFKINKIQTPVCRRYDLVGLGWRAGSLVFTSSID